METKHTKGEWVLKEQGDANEYVMITTEHKWVVAFRINGEFHKEEEMANAKLIAAAPIMISDLIDEVDFLQGLLDDDGNPLPTCVHNTIRFRINVLNKTIKKAIE